MIKSPFITRIALLCLVVGNSCQLSAAKSIGETVTEKSNQTCGNNSARDIVGALESGGSGGYQAVNSHGYLGRYQIGEAKLQDLGYTIPDGNSKDNSFTWSAKARRELNVSNNQDFLNQPDIQERVYTEINQLNIDYLDDANRAIGDTLPCGSTITQDALLAGAQFGAQKVKNYVNNGYKCIYEGGAQENTVDGNGVCVEKYMCAVAGCSTIQKDMSKKTCDVVMPMLSAIDCSTYPPQAQKFCKKYKPQLMTRAQCDTAEELSKEAEKGPNADACENMTFGPGTGSWSFVLACSFAENLPADQDGVTNPPTFVGDPECISKLRETGAQFSELGNYTNGSIGGYSCVIPNAVSISRSPSMEWGRKLTLMCDTALQMVNFDKELKSLGASEYYDISSTRTCGPKRDKNGNKPGTVTEHALGRAIDVGGFIVNGTKYSFGEIANAKNGAGTAKTAIVKKAYDAACENFNLVLSPNYPGYQGAYVHFHLEQAGMSGCE
ncbi:extensin family protein [Flexibacterium corallicola]|uniref:extensin family protein n=1 Tax=Flexibacterium corallicola TaxID=3037259 RepID=UPI00286FAD94|nr:extensin family protein [Pseudovibrio sp. M1P-2-3]